MNNKEFNINIIANRENPEVRKKVNIEKAKEKLLSLDKEDKLIMAPNQKTVGEIEMWQDHLFESRSELDGKSAYDYFDKIFIGHGKGPADLKKRRFKGGKNLPEEFKGTMSELKDKMASDKEKVLFVVCGSKKESKVDLTRAINEYLKK